MESFMRRMFFCILPCLFLPGCRQPDPSRIESFASHPPPIEVRLSVKADCHAPERVQEYAAVLCTQLAARTTVVPIGVQSPPDVAILQVQITSVKTHAPSAAAVGVGTGMAVSGLSAVAGSRGPGAIFEGLFFGLFAGSATAQNQAKDRQRLGFTPVRISAKVRLSRTGQSDPLDEFSVDSDEAIEQMEALPIDESRDSARIPKEEAKGFARAVIAHLHERFHWMPLNQPSYYQPRVTLSLPVEMPIQAIPPTDSEHSKPEPKSESDTKE
jgi:hypothetical protein